VHPMFVDYQWPMSAISIGYSINLLIYALGGLVSGRLLDRMAPQVDNDDWGMPRRARFYLHRLCPYAGAAVPDLWCFVWLKGPPG